MFITYINMYIIILTSTLIFLLLSIHIFDKRQSFSIILPGINPIIKDVSILS